MKYKIVSKSKKLLADTLTPVNIYLKLRDVFAGSILLESSDYHSHENSLSLICCDPIASFTAKGNDIERRFPDGSVDARIVTAKGQVAELLEEFRKSIVPEKNTSKYTSCGLFGYMAYDA